MSGFYKRLSQHFSQWLEAYSFILHGRTAYKYGPNLPSPGMGAQISQKKNKGKRYNQIGDEEDVELLVVSNAFDPEPILTPQILIMQENLGTDVVHRVMQFRDELQQCISDTSMPTVLALRLKYTSSPVFDDLVDTVCKQALQLHGTMPVAIVNVQDALENDNTVSTIHNMRKSFARAAFKNVRIVVILNSYLTVLYFTDLAAGAYLQDDVHVPLASLTKLPVLTCTEKHINDCQQSYKIVGLSGNGNICKFVSSGNLRTLLLTPLLFLSKAPQTHALYDSAFFETGDDLQHVFDLL